MTVSSLLAPLFPYARDIPPDFAALLPREERLWLADGDLRTWAGPMDEVFSPVLVHGPGGLAPRRLGSVPALDEAAALHALAAASLAYSAGAGHWPSLPLAARLRAVERFARLLAPLRGELARLIAWEVGKPLASALAEFDRTLAAIADTVEAAQGLGGSAAIPVSCGGLSARVGREPLGVVLCLGPSNHPLNETLGTLIPALVMGNTAVVKAPRIGRLCLAPLLRPLAEAFPPGVVNVLFGGAELAQAVMATGRVDALAFIGTAQAAQALRAAHPRPHRLRCVLGLGAKNPAILLPDADLDLAVAECLRGALALGGQRCTALKLLWVPRVLEREFLERFATAMRGLVLGMPWTPGAGITPLAEPDRPVYLRGLLDEALAQGARLVNPDGGQACGSLFSPALVAGVAGHMRMAREEQFGPVVPVAAYDDVEEPLAHLAEADHGQQASLFGRDPNRLEHVAARLSRLVCRVNLNRKCQRGPDSLPFTGRRDSALGDLSIPGVLSALSMDSVVVRDMI